MENKNKYLTKVGIYFLIHSLFALGIMIFIKFDLRNAKKYYRTLRLDKTFLVLIIISLVLKIVYGFIARRLKFLNLIVFLIDSILLSCICLGLYFYLEEYKRIYYISNGFFVAIYSLSFTLMSLGFILSTLFKSKKMTYNYWFGIISMFIAAMISLKLIDSFWMEKPM